MANALECVKVQGLVENVSTPISTVRKPLSIRCIRQIVVEETRCIITPGQEICKECHNHQQRHVHHTQALQSGEAEIVDTRPNLHMWVALHESMLERLVQVEPSGTAEVLSGSDLPIYGRRGSGAS